MNSGSSLFSGGRGWFRPKCVFYLKFWGLILIEIQRFYFLRSICSHVDSVP